MTTFIKKLEQCWQKDNLVCVGLDPDFDQLPTTSEKSTIS